MVAYTKPNNGRKQKAKRRERRSDQIYQLGYHASLLS